MRYKCIVFSEPGKDSHFFYDTTFHDAFMAMNCGAKYVLEDGGFKWKKVYQGQDVIKNFKMTISFYYY